MSLWDRFDGIASADEVMEAKSKFENPEAGVYEAVLESIEPAENKDGLPVLKGRFRTKENKSLFYYQNLQNLNYPDMTAVNIAEAVKFVSAVIGEEIEYQGLSHLAGIVEGIKTGGEFTVEVKYSAKDLEQKWPKLSIVSKDDVPF